MALIFVYRDSFPTEWSNYGNLVLPVAFTSAFLLIAALWVLPKFYVRSLQKRDSGSTQSEFDREKERLKLEDDTRKTVAQIIGGAVFLLGSVLTFNTYRLNVEKQALDHEGQITDRFSKAVSQLGDKDLAVRLGGLYALERISKDSPKDHWAIMEIISAYVREKSPRKRSGASVNSNGNTPAKIGDSGSDTVRDGETPSPKKPASTPASKKTTGSETKKQVGPENERVKTDIQAALRIIGRRIVSQDPVRTKIDLGGANLSGANLYAANLSGAYLNGADLSEAELGAANLSAAELSGANLSGAGLIGTNLGKANLSAAELSGAHFYVADLSQANLILATNLTLEQLTVAIVDEQTTLPLDFEPNREKLLEISVQNREIREAYYDLIKPSSK